ncbi:UNVERIFIED_CONTAM: hypothetical protein GTU68_052198 [Idotea baltica]|nr:hypothetical protein [Idotea baltica]
MEPKNDSDALSTQLSLFPRSSAIFNDNKRLKREYRLGWNVLILLTNRLLRRCVMC